jgi:hypothetical protein
MTQKSNLLTIESLAELASVQQPPCLSLYQPTHRSRPENQQDPIRFRNLVKELEISLRQKYPAVETRLPLERFAALAHDDAFWNRAREGLAVLGGTVRTVDDSGPIEKRSSTSTEILFCYPTDSPI